MCEMWRFYASLQANLWVKRQFARLQMALDEQEAILEHVTDFLSNAFAFTRQAASFFIFGRGASSL